MGSEATERRRRGVYGSGGGGTDRESVRERETEQDPQTAETTQSGFDDGETGSSPASSSGGVESGSRSLARERDERQAGP